MNIEKMKEFIALRQDLRAAGVIGVNMYENELHVEKAQLANMPGVQLKIRNFNDYPFEIFSIVDGIKLFAILKKEEIAEFPQVAKMLAELRQQSYLKEDVDLSGMGDETNVS